MVLLSSYAFGGLVCHACTYNAHDYGGKGRDSEKEEVVPNNCAIP